MLRAGADDYLLRPFDLNELVARLQALLGRAARPSVGMIEHGPLRLDPRERGSLAERSRRGLVARRISAAGSSAAGTRPNSEPRPA